jgi:hypothetical protein
MPIPRRVTIESGVATTAPDRPALLVRRHLAFGWWSLFVFSTLGLFLEVLHGFKAGLYVDASNDTRRLMWTLGHAHGTFLAIVHLVFAIALGSVPGLGGSRRRLISRCLIGASVLLPAGFFVAGIRFYAGDPGLGILLVPPGAVLLLVALALTARSSNAALVDRESAPRARRD